MSAKPVDDMDEVELKAHLRRIADGIKAAIAPDELFVCIIFGRSGEHIGQYISNANRKGVIKSMREFANAMESKEDIPR